MRRARKAKEHRPALVVVVVVVAVGSVLVVLVAIGSVADHHYRFGKPGDQGTYQRKRKKTRLVG